MDESSNKETVSPKIEKDRQMLVNARQKGKLATLGAWARLSGPGWLQSAITIGGGSLSNSLYLGVLVGFACMWVQPVAMILGVTMLAAISYVTLSTGQRPLKAINDHVSPLLGWGWLIGAMMANVVWALPQYSLSAAALQQNLFPDFFGWGTTDGVFGSIGAGTAAAATIILAIALFNVMLYIKGGVGVKIFEITIKVIIGMIVICFFGVIIKLSSMDGSALEWKKVFAGLIPDLSLFNEPASGIAAEISKVGKDFQEFWTRHVVGLQRDVMIGAASTAVGINMTFLLPYSMLRKGWNKDFRHLAIFDLATGLVIPFSLATGCVVMATATQFHTNPAPGFLGETDAGGQLIVPANNLKGPYRKLLDKRIDHENKMDIIEERNSLRNELAEAKKTGSNKEVILASEKKLDTFYKEKVPHADRRMAAMLVKRDSFNLAASLAPLMGEGLSMYIFGLGVVAMTLNAATMLMLINGLCLCELLGRPLKGMTQIIGSLIPGIGVLGAFFWNQASMWLAVPTSVFCAALLPIAYIAFALLINQKKLMGDSMPKGAGRLIWNLLMVCAVVATGALSLWALWDKGGLISDKWLGLGRTVGNYAGIGLFIGFGILVIIVHFCSSGKNKSLTNE